PARLGEALARPGRRLRRRKNRAHEKMRRRGFAVQPGREAVFAGARAGSLLKWPALQPPV
ncbi:MAG: hypothetical protein VB131_10225, partial [Burkholderia gladioli]